MLAWLQLNVPSAVWTSYILRWIQIMWPVGGFDCSFLCCSICWGLSHFMLLFSFYTPWKHQKTSSFLIFSRDIERNLWCEMGLISFQFWSRVNLFSKLRIVVFDVAFWLSTSIIFNMSNEICNILPFWLFLVVQLF